MTLSLSDAANLATLVALVINIFALLYTAYQIKLSRVSLVTTNKSLELSTRTMQIEMLPKIHWVVGVQVKLESWIQELNKVITKCNQADKNQDEQMLIQLSKEGLKCPKGLVDKYFYDNAPKWLSIIMIAGAQYYYDSKAPQLDLWDSRNIPKFDYLPSFIERCHDSINGLRKLLSYIDDVVPVPLLNTPASISDEEFLT